MMDPQLFRQGEGRTLAPAARADCAGNVPKLPRQDRARFPPRQAPSSTSNSTPGARAVGEWEAIRARASRNQPRLQALCLESSCSEIGQRACGGVCRKNELADVESTS